MFQQQKTARTYLEQHNTQIMSWGPFAEGRGDMFTNPVLTEIGKKYGKTAAQTALRFLLQSGVVIIPKSVHKERIEQNLDIWDFQLSQKDMEEISGLDVGHSEIVSHDDPGFIKMLHGLKIHD